jgi:hypothetical protein
MDVATVARSCFKNNAHEMMVHMLMWMHRCKANTWGVTFNNKQRLGSLSSNLCDDEWSMVMLLCTGIVVL